MSVSIQDERPPHRFTVEQYHRMGEAGVFDEDDRVELLRGEIVRMTPIGSKHAGHVDRLNSLLHEQIGRKATLRVQNPVRLGEYSEPEPDVALLRPRDDFYVSEHPGPEDVQLLIEVADTSIDYDREDKIPVYARHGIPMVWLVDLAEECVEIYRSPAEGAYADTRTATDDESLQVESLPTLDLTPNEIFV